MKRIGTTLIAIAFLLSACTVDETINPLDGELVRTLERLSPTGTVDHFILPQADDYTAIPQDPANPLTADKVFLGRMLFYETALARDAAKAAGVGTYSCSTCHIPEAGFMPGRSQGIADGGIGFGFNGESRTKVNVYDETEMDVQGARALSLLNVAFVENTTWSGKFGSRGNNAEFEAIFGVTDPMTEINHLGLKGLETQNLEGFKLHRMSLDEYILDTLGYRKYFDAAFPEMEEEERYGDLGLSFAVSAYLRTLLTTEAPFQKWMKGDYNAMTEVEKSGAILFYGKAGCYRCHIGPALNANEFYALGVKDLYQSYGNFNTGPDDIRNLGRGGFTGREEDMFEFKVPGIYNMGDSRFYFHGSSHYSLRSVVEYFNEGLPENPNVPPGQIAPHLQPLDLNEGEIRDLVQFLETGLRDPDLLRYVPEQTLSGNCFPNNDSQSRQDMGCQ